MTKPHRPKLSPKADPDMSGPDSGHETAFVTAAKATGNGFRRAGAGARKHAVSIGVSAVFTLVSSTFIPMIQQHWADEGVQAQIAEQKADRIREEGSLWHEIHALQNQASGKTTNYLTDPIYASQ